MVTNIEVNNIYNADCLIGMKEIDNESINMIITDPPYGIDYQSSRRTDKDKRIPKIQNDKSPFIWFLYDAFRVLKAGGGILCFCRWDTEHDFLLAMKWAGFSVKSSIVWDRQHHGMGDLKGSFAPTHDIILFGTKGRFEFPGKRPKDVISCQRLNADKLRHPNEKPVELMAKLIEFVSKQGDIILDPFVGSGTTIEACKNTGRNYIGFEIDKSYFDMSIKRVVVPNKAFDN